MIMVSHLNIPALDNTPGSIATTSYKIVTELLRNEMGFNGIIITDGMEMDGLRKTYPKGAVAEIKCLQAGIDVLLLPNELSIIIPAIKKAVENGEISEASIDEKCLRVLQMKEKWGINTFQPLNSGNVVKQLNDEKVKDLIKQMETKALTLVKNEKQFLPLQGREKIGVMFIGDPENESFTKKICQEFGLPFVKIDKNIKKEDFPAALAKFSKFDQVIVVYLSTNQAPSRNYGITQTSVAFLNELGKSKKVILSLFGNPYALAQFKSLNRFDAAIVGYQRTENSVRAAFQGIFGEAPFEGLLPIAVLDYKSQTNAYLGQKAEGRKQKAGAAEVSFFSEKYRKEIDRMIAESIEEKVFPGCQILVYKKGKTLFVKNYGTTNYDNNNRVTAHTMYDVASITKPLATTLALMKLYDEKKFSLKDTIGQYVSWLAGSDKSGLRIEELLTHTAGLPAFVPFYKNLMHDSVKMNYLSNFETDVFNIPVANNLFLNSGYQDTIKRKFCDLKLRPKKYLYSDLGLFLLKEMVENITNESCEEYIFSQFYKPLGLEHTVFNPALKGFDLERVAPTENDTLFRLQMMHGYVHDQTSALFGGFAGNSGLFSTAEDLSVILEMLMNKGTYKGKRYLSEKTVQLFTSPYFCNGTKRRALGFYTPASEKPSEILPKQSDARTFGHQGFTGTVFWCDPKEDLIYIFLSNRVHPNVEPNLLSQKKIRLLVHELIYESLR
jgi:CubicO group peptidase (beta-lactamase class C family)